MKNLFVEQASLVEAEQVCSGLRQFNDDAIGEIRFTPIHLVARDGNGGVLAGIVAEVALGWLEVIALWVDEGARGRGIGSALLASCEEKAILLGAHSARLDTFEWQALDFYAKHDYSVFGELADYPEGKKRYFMAKRLDASTA